jgi:hypothetical protein
MKSLIPILAVILVLCGCRNDRGERQLMTVLPTGLHSFATDPADSALKEHKRLWEMAHALERENGFRKMSADGTIGLLALRLYALEEEVGDSPAAEAYKRESIARFMADRTIPRELSPEKKEELWNGMLRDLFEYEKPIWKRHDRQPNQAAEPSRTAVTAPASA